VPAVIDPRAPVVVGVGQTSQRVAADVARAPIDLLADAARAADDDTGTSTSLLERADIVAVVAIGSWRYPDAGAFLARELRITPRATAVSTVGGNSPQVLVSEFATRIQQGECDVVLIGGGESMHTRWRARREPRVELTWETGDDAPCAWVIGDDRPGASDYEMAHLAVAPTMVYPLFETALRNELEHDVEQHQKHVSELWSGFAKVSEHNPHAWSHTAYSPEEIRTVSADNRMVCFPYPKRMCANIDVDQAAALLLCSYEAARAAGIADDRMVFLHSASAAHDHYFMTERWSLAASPAINASVRAALGAARIGIDDVAHLDLYSCFPSAVQIAAREIGVTGNGRPLTVTGGLGFAGGPLNNYPTHAIATMVDVLRRDPDAYGLTTALGWYVTKHAVGVWSARPPEQPFTLSNAQAGVDALPARTPAGLIEGEVSLEATAVSVERDGTPTLGIISALAADGSRALMNTRDTDVLSDMMVDAWEGKSVRVTNDGTTNSLAT
jgi:acetyl-CoA C-acetyltransferase